MNVVRWLGYVERLEWRKGSLDNSSWKAALRAASLGVDKDKVYKAICDKIVLAGDQPKPEKLWSQIERAYADDREPRRRARTSRKVNGSYSFDLGALQSIANNFPVQDLIEFIKRKSASNSDYLSCGGFLDELYNYGESVLIFTKMQSQGALLWRRGVTPSNTIPTGGPEGVWFIPNPIDGLYHPNPRQSGKKSRRSQESIVEFRYAVLESDEAPPDLWLNWLCQLPIPIESICESGGRSIHALVRVSAPTKDAWDSMIMPVKPLLTRLGADPHALSAVRLTRLPQAFRGERQQRLLYLRPNASGIPIKDLPDRPLWRDWLDWALGCRNMQFCPAREDALRCMQILLPHILEPNVKGCCEWLEVVSARGGGI